MNNDFGRTTGVENDDDPGYILYAAQIMRFTPSKWARKNTKVKWKPEEPMVLFKRSPDILA